MSLIKKQYLVFKVIGKVMNSGFPCKDHSIQTIPRIFDSRKEAEVFIVKESDSEIKYLIYYLIEVNHPIKLEKFKFK